MAPAIAVGASRACRDCGAIYASEKKYKDYRCCPCSRRHGRERYAARRAAGVLPPAMGFWWIRLFPGSEWQPAYTDGSEWWIVGEEGSFGELVEVGPRIEPPE